MKNKIYKFGLVLSLLLLAACGSNAETVVDPEINEELVSPEIEVLLEQQNGQADGEDETGEEISAAQIEADRAFMSQARAELDLTICEKINSQIIKQDCIDVTSYRLVAASQNEDCSMIKNTDLKLLCEDKLKEIGQNQLNAELRKQATTATDPSFCEKISEPADKDACLMQIAFSQNDPQICERFEDDVTKQDCLEQL